MLVHQHVDKGSESPWVLVLLSFQVYLTLLAPPEEKQHILIQVSQSLEILSFSRNSYAI